MTKLAFIGHWEILALLGIVVLLFGATKLPALGSGIGSFVRNLKKSLNEKEEIDVSPSKDSKKEIDEKEGKSS